MSFGGNKRKGPPPPAWHQFVLSATSGMIASAATHPLDLIKVRIQVARGAAGSAEAAAEGIFKTGAKVFSTEGVPGLYKGLTASLLRQATYTNARIGLYLRLKEVFVDEKGQSTLWMKIAASMLAGAGGAMCGNPADVIMVRMQADGRLPAEQRRNYRHAFDGVFRIAREEGVGTLWKGTMPNLQRAMLMNAGQMATYDTVKASLVGSGIGIFSDNPFTHTVASTIAAFVATVLTNPLDVVKTRIMNQKQGEYKNSLDCFAKTLRAEGPMAFYKGFIPFFLRLGPHTVITMLAFEQLEKLLNKVTGRDV